jgi:hypothetical protein
MKNNEKKNIDCEDYLATDSEKFNDLLDKIKNLKQYESKKKLGDFKNVYSDDSDDDEYNSENVITTYENKSDISKKDHNSNISSTDFVSKKIKKKIKEILDSDNSSPQNISDNQNISMNLNKNISEIASRNISDNFENINDINMIDFLNKIMEKVNLKKPTKIIPDNNSDYENTVNTEKPDNNTKTILLRRKIVRNN